MRQLPPKNHVESDPKGLLKLIRRVSETVAIKSSKDGSSRHSEKTHSSSGLPRENSDEERLDLEDLCFDADVSFFCLLYVFCSVLRFTFFFLFYPLGRLV